MRVLRCHTDGRAGDPPIIQQPLRQHQRRLFLQFFTQLPFLVVASQLPRLLRWRPFRWWRPSWEVVSCRLQRQKLMVAGQNKLTTAIHNKLIKGDCYGNNTGEIGGIIGGFEVVSRCPWRQFGDPRCGYAGTDTYGAIGEQRISDHGHHRKTLTD